MDTVKRYAPYLLFILPAIAFALAGTFKLLGTPELHQSFAAMGLPGWFGYFIGACELAGAIALVFLPALRKLAAVGLLIIMAGAIYFHVAYEVPSAVPAIILSLLLIGVIYWPWNRQPA